MKDLLPGEQADNVHPLYVTSTDADKRLQVPNVIATKGHIEHHRLHTVHQEPECTDSSNSMPVRDGTRFNRVMDGRLSRRFGHAFQNGHGPPGNPSKCSGVQNEESDVAHEGRGSLHKHPGGMSLLTPRKHLSLQIGSSPTMVRNPKGSEDPRYGNRTDWKSVLGRSTTPSMKMIPKTCSDPDQTLQGYLRQSRRQSATLTYQVTSTAKNCLPQPRQRHDAPLKIPERFRI